METNVSACSVGTHSVNLTCYNYLFCELSKREITLEYQCPLRHMQYDCYATVCVNVCAHV